MYGYFGILSVCYGCRRGALTYSCFGWVKYGKAMGEKFDPAKTLDPLFQGGFSSSAVVLVLQYYNFAGVNIFNIAFFGAAYLGGFLLSAGINEGKNIISPSGQINWATVIDDLATLKAKVSAASIPPSSATPKSEPPQTAQAT